MVLANRPWLLVPGLKSALVAALATGAVATINSTVWLVAGSLSWWRLTVATIASIALVVAWLVIDGELWDRPDDDSAQARERSRLYNTSTLVTLTTGVLICYLALYVVNLVWALFVLDPAVMGGYLSASLDYGDLFVLAWFVASAATVGGGLGTGLESDEAIRAAAYSSARRSAATGSHANGPRRGTHESAPTAGRRQPNRIEERNAHEADEYDHGAAAAGGGLRLLARPREPTRVHGAPGRGPRHRPLAAATGGQRTIRSDRGVGRRDHVDEPRQGIAWRSVGDADVPNDGEVLFVPAPGGREHRGPGDPGLRHSGRPLGRAVAKYFGEEPHQQLDDDLRRSSRCWRPARSCGPTAPRGASGPRGVPAAPGAAAVATTSWRRERGDEGEAPLDGPQQGRRSATCPTPRS